MTQSVCTCFMCNNIRTALHNIDPEYTRSIERRLSVPQGLDHKALITRYRYEYPDYLKAMKAKVEHELVIAELQLKKSEVEVKQLRLDIETGRLQREKAEDQVRMNSSVVTTGLLDSFEEK
ncbi:uncharacterized protein AB675_305 [Cyphellophora attinorum]|uniref:Uncharacterized protein n=1 Tax=Cyphellophora attinorum TaxID=1664694 RepID=A0A0N1I153_9EURO|nr:uncharacterized protein AB675_305 [Phialophora attinorum]KPI45474.1 hypothetical protein AB675_305 [Phialophora attinorum]